MIAAFTGHRPDKLPNKQIGYKIPNPFYTGICQRLRSALIEFKPEKAISGMALGVDQWAAEICIELGIPFIAAVPFKGQELFWPKESQDKYHELLAAANSIEIVNPGGYASWKMQARNQFMVDRCDILIAVFNGTPGGTKNCFEYAKKNNKRVFRIDPNEFK